MDRRGFLKTIAGFAALAATPSAFKATIEHLPLHDGILQPYTIIENQTFILDKPYVIELPYTIIRNCVFIAQVGGFDGPMLEVSVNTHDVTITGCFFKNEGYSNITTSGIINLREGVS